MDYVMKCSKKKKRAFYIKGPLCDSENKKLSPEFLVHYRCKAYLLALGNCLKKFLNVFVSTIMIP